VRPPLAPPVPSPPLLPCVLPLVAWPRRALLYAAPSPPPEPSCPNPVPRCRAGMHVSHLLLLHLGRSAARPAPPLPRCSGRFVCCLPAFEFLLAAPAGAQASGACAPRRQGLPRRHPGGAARAVGLQLHPGVHPAGPAHDGEWAAGGVGWAGWNRLEAVVTGGRQVVRSLKLARVLRGIVWDVSYRRHARCLGPTAGVPGCRAALCWPL
jgi:hypothetical protein